MTLGEFREVTQSLPDALEMVVKPPAGQLVFRVEAALVSLTAPRTVAVNEGPSRVWMLVQEPADDTVAVLVVQTKGI